jgi:hypothetical protein
MIHVTDDAGGESFRGLATGNGVDADLGQDPAVALLSIRMGTSQDETEQLVTARMERQVILERTDPPLLWVVIDEHALRRPVGAGR